MLSAEQQALFEKFYAEYPLNKSRATAESAWAKITPTPDEAMTEKIIEAVHNAQKYDNRFRDKQFKVNDLCHIADALGCWVGEFLEEGKSI